MLRKVNKSNDSFIKSVIVLVTGTAGAQFLAIAVSPILTRLYGADAFGVLGTFNAMANMIIPIAALTYPIAIVLPKKDEEAIGLMKLSIIVALILSLISLVIISLFQEPIAKLFNMQSIEGYLYLIPLLIIFAGLMQSGKQWLIRQRRFLINAKSTFWASLISNGSKVGVGFYYPYAPVLILLTVANNAIRAYILFKDIIIRQKTNLKRKHKSYGQLAKQYRDFPIYRAPESLLTGVGHGAPVLMLASFFGPAAAGFYTLGRSVLTLPTILIGEAVGDVFYPKVTENFHKGKDISRLIIKFTFYLFLISLIPYLLIIIFAPQLFSFVFGAEWHQAGEYARWIAIWSLTNFINKPAGRSLAVINAQRYHLLYTIFSLVLKIAALAAGFYIFQSDIIAIALYGIVGGVLNIGLISMTVILSKSAIKRKKNSEHINEEV